MGVRYNLASPALLCGEDNSSILCFDDLDGEGEVGFVGGDGGGRRGLQVVVGEQRSLLYQGVSVALPLHSHESIAWLVERETHHLPEQNYAARLQTGAADASARNDALDWISKVHSYYNFGPVSLYLSVNYLDRFISLYELPQGKSWMAQLLSVASLSLAVKMEESDAPSSLDLQVCGAKFVFEARTVQRMELLVMSTLRWRMQAVTPFSFLDYFLAEFYHRNPPTSAMLLRSMELIPGTLKGIGFLQFRPSEVGAAAALSVLSEARGVDIRDALSCCIPVVDKERVMRCYELINKEVAAMERRINGNPQSPVGVLDAASLSYKSDDGSSADSNKRRKVMSMQITSLIVREE